MSIRTITPRELDLLRRGGRPIDLIDVRTPAEYDEIHAECARLIPLDSLDPKAILAARSVAVHGGEPIYTICRSGARGLQACERFLKAGFAEVVNVEGGTLAWERDNLPVIRGRRRISLERQVRMAAGALVVLGTALGAFVHPAFLGLAAFVGAGLFFAGATDTCGMGMVLARMPWNRVGDSSRSGQTPALGSSEAKGDR